MTTLTGRCFCGQVRYTVTGPELYSCYCHCESCRRSSGGSVVAWATFERNNFSIVAGALTEHHSAPGVTRGLCSACGTSLTYEHENRPGQIDITLASLEDPAAIRPRSHVWLEDKLPWVEIDDDLPRFERTVG